MKPHVILTALGALDWRGHVELPDIDLQWLARELHRSLFSSDTSRCDICHSYKDICVTTPVGVLCEDCIDDAAGTAEDMREEMEAE